MPQNFADLQAEIDKLIAQVTATKTVEASAKALIEGFAAKVTEAVTKALTEDDAADQGSIDVAKAAIADATAQYAASATELGVAVAANTPQAPPPSAPPA